MRERLVDLLPSCLVGVLGHGPTEPKLP
jgi:hypothetical protein